MKKNIILKIILIAVVLVITIGCNMVYATGDGLPTLNDPGYKPTVTLPKSGKGWSAIITVLNVLTILGIVAVVVSIVLIGFNSILGSASQKAVDQQKYVGIVIAALLITAGSTIAKIIIQAAETAL